MTHQIDVGIAFVSVIILSISFLLLSILLGILFITLFTGKQIRISSPVEENSCYHFEADTDKNEGSCAEEDTDQAQDGFITHI